MNTEREQVTTIESNIWKCAKCDDDHTSHANQDKKHFENDRSETIDNIAARKREQLFNMIEFQRRFGE